MVLTMAEVPQFLACSFQDGWIGEAHATVDNGDLDCLEMRRILEAKGFDGPAIFEIPPDAEVFDNLEASFAYMGFGGRT